VVAQIVQYLCNAAHPDAADPHKMDMLNLPLAIHS
jgi:hypothetical protein